MTTYATIEQGTTEHLARILEPGKAPYYFIPPYEAPTPTQLQQIVRSAFPDIQFISEEEFNRKVENQTR